MRPLTFLLTTVTLLTTPTTASGLTFSVASAQQDGRDIDPSHLTFLPIPPRKHQHRKPPSSSASRQPPSHPHHPGTTTSTTNGDINGRDVTSYSANWCGASQHSPGNGKDVVSNVFGFFTVPDLTLREGVGAPQFAAAWVGVDGAECNGTLLQAGVTTIVNSNGGQSASAWWEWYPEAAFTIDGLRVKPGDWMSVNITALDATSARIIITNAQRGSSVSLVVNNGPKLCRVDAEWIVEDFYDAGKQVAFGHFSDVWFVDAAATTASGKNLGIDGAAMVNLRTDEGKILCTAERYDNSNFVVVSQK